MLRAHADADLLTTALASELKEWGASPAMVLEARLADAVAPSGFRLDRVESAADAAEFAEVMSAAYATYGMPPDVAPAILFLLSDAAKMCTGAEIVVDGGALLGSGDAYGSYFERRGATAPDRNIEIPDV